MCSAGGSAALPATGFPHSGIHGSKAVQRLTVAYRSRPRPSSTLDAKASTMCPYYLDGDQSRTRQGSAGDTRATRDSSTAGGCGCCAVVKDRPRGVRAHARRHVGRRGRAVSQNSTACTRGRAPRMRGTARARLGRHARPHGRRPAGRSPAATRATDGADGAVPYGHRSGAP